MGPGSDEILGSPVTASFVADALCVNGWSLNAIGLRGWWVERRDSKGKVGRVVPDYQRKALADALRVTLDGIDAAWQAKAIARHLSSAGSRWNRGVPPLKLPVI